jgi:uncharacterized Zn-binding protein involved in type VI secretion
VPAVVRKGDVNSSGGVVSGPCAPTVFVNNRPISVVGDKITPHPCCGKRGCGAHCAASTKGGTSTIFAEGKRVIVVGDTDTCGHSRSTGSPDVYFE